MRQRVERTAALRFLSVGNLPRHHLAVLEGVDVRVNGSAARAVAAIARTVAAAAIRFRRSRCENIKVASI